MVVGIKHAKVQGESSRVPYLFLPEGFMDQILQMATVSGAEFSGSSWEDLIEWFEHYTAEGYFAGGGRAPLMYEACHYLRPPWISAALRRSKCSGPSRQLG